MESLLSIPKIKELCDKNKKLYKIVKNVKRHIKDNERYKKRIIKEFLLIKKNKFEKVFLHVISILKMLNGFPHVIRGSAGSSLLCYLLGITNFDPIEENIVLSRFMHKERMDMPDIDIDVPHYKHKEIFQKVYSKWGDRAARISNHNMYSEKSAVREAIRDEGHRKFVPKNFTLKIIFKEDEVVNRVKKQTKKYIGKLKCYSQHCGGVVILDKQIPKEYLLENKPKQLKLNKDQAEKEGLIKIDILSSRGLGQLWDIEQKAIIDYEYDSEVYKVFEEGNNIGITFGESPAMRKLFRINKPNSINDLADILGLVRPCASKSKNYVREMKNCGKSISNDLTPIIFDDDGTIIIKGLLKCMDSEAELYRKAFSKGKENLIKLFRKKIRSHPESNLIINNLRFLKYYSFCKSHAFSYAQLLYALAYQKKYNAKKFWVAAINNCHSTYKKWVYYSEAMGSGLKLYIGNPPWKIVNNKMLMVEKKCQQRLIIDDISDFKKYGYWTSGKFLNGMYCNFSTLSNSDYQEEQYIEFRGLIALSRRYMNNDMDDTLTFVTIGYDFGKYLDLSIEGNKNVYGDIAEGTGYYRNHTCYVDDIKFSKI